MNKQHRAIQEILKQFGVESRYEEAVNQWYIGEGIARGDCICHLKSVKLRGCSKFALSFPFAPEHLSVDEGKAALERMSRVIMCLQQLEALDPDLVKQST